MSTAPFRWDGNAVCNSNPACFTCHSQAPDVFEGWWLHKDSVLSGCIRTHVAHHNNNLAHSVIPT